MFAICLKSLCVFVRWRRIIDKRVRVVPGLRSWLALTLTARVCDQICQSHSAVCLPGVWQSFDAAQALERIKPFLNWLYLAPSATGALLTHQPPIHLSSAVTDELFISKNMCSLLDHQRALNNSALRGLVEQSKKTKSSGHTWFPHH